VASRKSSALKSLIWRIIGVLILGAVTYFFTRKWVVTGLIAFWHNFSFIWIFYAHERFWLWFKKPNHPIKAITYEIILGMGIGGLIVYLFTGQWSKVTRITGTYTAIKLIMYYINEKVWSKIEKR